MIPPRDDLQQMWRAGSGGLAGPTAELIHNVQGKMLDFDRTIRWRDLRETAAAVFIAIVFSWFAIRGGAPLERFANIWLAGWGVCIVFFLRRYSQASRKPLPDMTLSAYSHALQERYERQIRLLKNAKYWYVFPFWVGMMLNAVAYLEHHGSIVRFLILSAGVTVFSGAIWWLNESIAAGYIESKRRELLARMENGED
ncbi:MAG TPA: hypothetical protein VKU01_04175 [Bryobacteraceae bacterium]|nr:hypothetical protein [Bryobacteraceae bacterium]